MITKLEIFERAVSEGQYIVDRKATVRQTSKVFRISKTSIHKDVTQALPQVNPQLAREVQAVLEENKSLRHIRGGMATKNKYQKK